MNKIKIYALSSSSDPDNIRYIGKTKETLKQRLSRHILSSKNEKTYKANWIRKELSIGNNILIKNIFTVPKDDEWQKWEIHFISEYKNKGFKLTNLTIGGEDLSGENNPFFGKNHKKSTKKLLRESSLTKKTINQYNLNGDLITSFISIGEASEKTGIPKSSISDVCQKKPKYKTAGGYVWRYSGEPFSLEYDNPAEHLRKEICQYNKKGELLSEYESISKAHEKTNIPVGSISQCCNKKLKTAGGYIWRFKGEIFSKPSNRSDAKKVIQYTLTGAYVNEFNSAKEASKKTGVYYSGIYNCCNGKYEQSGGFKWEFSK